MCRLICAFVVRIRHNRFSHDVTQIIICNKEVNYPDILPQERLPEHWSLSCNSPVNIDVIVCNSTTRNEFMESDSSFFGTSDKHFWDTLRSMSLWCLKAIFRKRHYWLIFKVPWTCWRQAGKLQCNDLVFIFIMTDENMLKWNFALELVTWLDVVAFNAV